MTHDTHSPRRSRAVPPDLAEPPPRPAGRSRRRLLVAMMAVVSTIAVLGHPTPAAAEAVDTDNVLIDTANADFGSGLHFFGAPADPGTVRWHDAVTENDPWVEVTGTLYLDEPFLGGCAFVWVRLVTVQFERVAGTADRTCRTAARPRPPVTWPPGPVWP